jgi:tRNA threonylcarbamoyladenosine biosynthesis protein TsaB
MASLSQQAYDDGRFENVAYFEPFYLKEFQATIAKNKVLNEALGKNK